MVGTVTDPSGAVVPGAQVTARNVNTGVRATANTDGTGNFRVPYLQPGQYTLEAQAGGFKRFIRKDISLELDRELRVDVALETGQASESISVTAEAAMVQTETGALSTTVENRQVVNLPLQGRNPQELKNLSAGVIKNRDGDIITNGGMVRKDPYYIDGAHSSNHVWSGTPVNPNPDVVSEVKVVTNSFSAEYGQTSGSVMLANTKSGTNEFHGTLFEFFRNNVLNAGNYYTGQKPIVRYNQFGGTLGGPVIKNKTFAFGGVQINRQRGTTVFNNQTLPLEAFRRGDFSSILGESLGTDLLGRPVFRNQIFDPASARTVKNASGADVVVRDAFAGNVIPMSRLSPAALKLQSYYPLPQTGSVRNNYSASGSNVTNQYAIDLKVDHNFSDKDKLMGRYSQTGNTQLMPQLFNEMIGGGSSYGTNSLNTARQAVLNYVRIIGSRTTNDLHLSYFRTFPKRYNAGYGKLSQADLGIMGMNTANEKKGAPLIEFGGTGGFTALGSPSGSLLLEKQESFALVNITTLVRGSHTIKFGGEVRKLRTDNIQPQPDNGRFFFNNVFTDQRGFNNTGYDYASFLLGLPQSYTYENYPGYISPRTSVYAVFVQDDYRVNKKLTLNLGLRWDAPLYWNERKNRSGVFDLDQKRFIQFGTNGFRTTNWNQDYNNFGPRFGFAYSPFAKNSTVVRGGYGIFTISQQGFGQSGGLPRQPIFADADAGRYTSVDLINPKTTLDLIPYTPADKTGSNAVSVGIYPANNPVSYFQQWNLNIGHQISSYFFEAGYAGSKGTHLPYGNYNLNAIPPSMAPAAQGRFIAPYVAYPQYPNGVTVNTSIGSSNYNSLQVKVERRFAQGFGFLAAYTFQKTMAVGDLGYRDPLGNRNLDYGIEPNSAPHRFTIAYTYALPFGRGHRWLTNGIASQVLGGWEFNGITTLQSGFPLTVTTAQNQCQCGAINRPNVSRSPVLSSDKRSVNQWFDTGAFSIPAQFTIGNAGRGLFFGPGLVNHDLNLGKRFATPMLSERSNLEFRAEFYNLTNTPYFANPGTSLGGNNFGVITGVSGSSRTIQMALKFNF
ncbi:TonB-dependent receptor [Bryobacter aggregatus]|uniref:TonB-dependent receptor n=1 Tax=Bryobacter aggregatus TaxID=360054 RepID=UPI00138E1C75|nr:TonB-dependent receptor [Bryobacter aggregatus]